MNYKELEEGTKPLRKEYGNMGKLEAEDQYKTITMLEMTQYDKMSFMVDIARDGHPEALTYTCEQIMEYLHKEGVFDKIL